MKMIKKNSIFVPYNDETKFENKLLLIDIAIAFLAPRTVVAEQN